MSRPRRSAGPVLAKTTTAAASLPNDRDFTPSRTQSSPSRRAVSRGIPASEPACGSVSPMPTISSPLQIRGTHARATSGTALAAMIWPTSEPTTCRWATLMSPRPISSVTRPEVSRSSPRPPSSTGISGAISPAAPISLRSCGSMRPAFSRAWEPARRCSVASARARSRYSCCVGVSAKSTVGSVVDDVLGEVRLALLGEGGGALHALGRDGVEVQSAHREVAQPGLVVGVGVERLLEEADGRGALLRDLERPGLGLLKQPIGRDDGVDQAHPLGLLGGVLAAEAPHLAGLLLPHDGGQGRRAEPGVEGTHARAGLAEAGVLAGDGDVAQHVQHVPPADGQAVDRGDDRLGDVADQLVQVADLEHAALRRPIVAGLRALLHVAAGAEGLLPRPGQDDRLDAPVRPRGAERGDELLDGLAAEGVVALRPVDGDDRDRPVGLVPDVLVVLPHGAGSFALAALPPRGCLPSVCSPPCQYLTLWSGVCGRVRKVQSGRTGGGTG